ncbi:hypothetical protein BFW38_06060 [Terasakiispira papahanaumokuakeensis]|uniref:Haemin-degrading HemS/ChuX domain-containing protein n=1 Tax=Terasakiispira papahanaumokuakeensis TaxID=197479 RepID=A0A1E2V939_9GAMM|nr:ChuX/HutX family heme-like substrate-binding protein [Terasakiispira papahanaumokuakeensis]ODC03175.1 hypothetical protein BFW38_06060 [Terasakiispira papahanaumokuakeensis]
MNPQQLLNIHTQGRGLWAQGEPARASLPTTAQRRADMSEGEWVVSQVGHATLWALRDPVSVMRRLPLLGKVRAIQSNGAVTHELVGRYPVPNLRKGRQPVSRFIATSGLDVRLSVQDCYWMVLRQFRHRHWSLQFFNVYGQALHQIRSTPHSDFTAWQSLRDEMQDVSGWIPDFLTPMSAPPVVTLVPSWQDFRQQWMAKAAHYSLDQQFKNHAHERYSGLIQLGAPLAEPMAWPKLERLLLGAHARHLSLLVTAGQAGAVQRYAGPIDRLHAIPGGYYLQGKGFSLFIDHEQMAEAFILRQPGPLGELTAIEVYDQQQKLVLRIESADAVESSEPLEWRLLVDSLS